jgi:hypothetical protein
MGRWAALTSRRVAAAVAKLPVRSCLIDGEAIVDGKDLPRGPIEDRSDPRRVAILQPATAKIDPLLFRSREPSEHPLSDHRPFELGKNPHHLKHRATRRCGGIEALLMQEKIDILGA